MQGWSGIPCNDDIINRNNSRCSTEDTLENILSQNSIWEQSLETVRVQGLELKGQRPIAQALGSRKCLCTLHQATSIPSPLRLSA